MVLEAVQTPQRPVLGLAHMAPLGGVYQAGTLSGNPVAVAAGLTTLKLIQEAGFYDRLSAQTSKLTHGLTEVARQAGIAFCADSIGGMFGLYFASKIPDSFAAMMQTDKELFNRFFHLMLDAGIYLAPSAYEAGFVSAQHDDAVITTTLNAAAEAFARLKQA